MLIFFHAQGPPESLRRDTYFDRLTIKPDSRLGVDLHVEPWTSEPPKLLK
jgi:hypothetical protein